MGQSRRNVLSESFRGPTPDAVNLGGVMIFERTDPAWLAAHPDHEQTGEKPGDDDILVSAMLTVQRTEPSAIWPGRPEKWNSSEVVALGPIFFANSKGDAQAATMTLANFKLITPLKLQGPSERPAIILPQLDDSDARAPFADGDTPKVEPDDGGNN